MKALYQLLPHFSASSHPYTTLTVTFLFSPLHNAGFLSFWNVLSAVPKAASFSSRTQVSPSQIYIKKPAPSKFVFSSDCLFSLHSEVEVPYKESSPLDLSSPLSQMLTHIC